MNDIKNTALFFEDLKKLRIDKNIELNEIATRTKINLEYLELLESGAYTFLPYVYIRLFVKAYAIEIGAEINEVLQQLDHFMDKQTPAEELPNTNKEEENDSLEDFQDSMQISSLNNHYTSLVKVVILFLIVFFGIWVVRQIAKDGSESIAVESQQTLIPKEPKITDTELNANFRFIDTEEELSLESPYKFAISANNETWYEIQTDLGNLTSSIITPENDLSIQFNEYLFLRIERSQDVSVSLNEQSLDLNKFSHPADIIYDGETRQLTIRNYTPL